MMSWLRYAVIPLLALLVIGNAPTSYVLDATSSSVSARVPFFGLSSKTAQFPNMAGTVQMSSASPEGALIDVTIDARALEAPDTTTLKRLRGEKFFWVERYPTVRFVGSNLTMTSKRTGKVAGRLTARGVTRPETLQVSFDTAPENAAPGQTITLSGEMTIDRRDYGMTAYQVIVGRKVKIRMQAKLVPQA